MSRQDAPTDLLKVFKMNMFVAYKLALDAQIDHLTI